MCTPHRGMSGTINAIKAEPFASASAEASLEQLNGYGDYLAQDEHMADVGSSISATLEPRDRKRVFKISVDFGTTFSAVAFVNPFEDEEDDFELLHRDEVKCILNYPYDPSHYGGVRSEVPSETWYPGDGLFEFLEENASEDLGDDRLDTLFDNIPERGDPELVDQAALVDSERASNPLKWGYEVQEHLRNLSGSDPSQRLRIAQSKLLLDDSPDPDTKAIRDKLKEAIKLLKQKRKAGCYEPIISDFLEKLFSHVKEQLTLYYEYESSCKIEWILTVPAMWSQKALRTMQMSMEFAIRKAGFPIAENGSLDLFIVTEPEAAAACLLADNHEFHVGLNESFVMLDAGGGTADATTYTVTSQLPLRLAVEVVRPDGKLHGSSYLNKAYEKLLQDKLNPQQTLLELNGMITQNYIDKAVWDFEHFWKRKLDITKPVKPQTVPMVGVRFDQDTGCIPNAVKISAKEQQQIFKPRLQGIFDLVKDQIDLAQEKGVLVRKVIMVGGFAGSPSLRNYLKKGFQLIAPTLADEIHLYCPPMPETAVAVGAVIRALNKKSGPQRITMSSYGFLRSEPFQPEVWSQHAELPRAPQRDELDGERYVKNTIDWLVKKGELIPSRRIYSIPVVYTFSTHVSTRFKCEEALYVSDTSTESHYRQRHPKNAGSEVAGTIKTDMTFLRKQNLIQPIEATFNEHGLQISKRHYKVEYEVVMIVDGRNLTFEARWPAGGAIQASKQISIASAFVPGTN